MITPSLTKEYRLNKVQN